MEEWVFGFRGSGFRVSREWRNGFLGLGIQGLGFRV